MNNILKLRPVLNRKNNRNGFGDLKLRKNSIVTSEKIENFIEQLIYVYNYWENSVIKGALVGIYYDSIVPKSRRVKQLFKGNYKDASESIVGARFKEGFEPKHIITHYISRETLKETIELIENVGDFIEKEFSGIVNSENFDTINKINISKYNLPLTKIKQIIVDLSSIEKFDLVEPEIEELNKQSIVTIYKTDIKTKDLFDILNIKVPRNRMIDDYTLLLDPDEIKTIRATIPYLISMSVVDLSRLVVDDINVSINKEYQIPNPNNEPVIGVIDTMFDKSVYFSKWVEFENMISSDIELSDNDFTHGTKVSSIIVDGPTLNPNLDDGCGRFRVKHFGVIKSGPSSSFNIMRKIEEIVRRNTNIKVWNLSLGSMVEVNKNFISFEAYILDKIQNDYDVIFVISGTNKPKHIDGEYRIGAPADSINGVVVNSVDFNNERVDYARKGIVLSFYHKPDISFYGGNSVKPLFAYGPKGVSAAIGTSYAAPWIARKLCFMIEKLGLSREISKALLIDSAIDWNEPKNLNEVAYIGKGVVPVHIDEIVRSKKDEIKFYIQGNANCYETYVHNLPVPEINGNHPFKVKGTFCYFPNINRNQGVDYTQTELEFSFGRINDKNEIISIDGNIQSYEGSYIKEEIAREQFRKWDNVKHIKEIIKPRSRPVRSYQNNLWALSIKKKNRISASLDDNLNFGVVITLKELNGINRLEDFKKLCLFRGISIEELNIENIINIYEKVEEDIEFEL